MSVTNITQTNPKLKINIIQPVRFTVYIHISTGSRGAGF